MFFYFPLLECGRIPAWTPLNTSRAVWARDFCKLIMYFKCFCSIFRFFSVVPAGASVYNPLLVAVTLWLLLSVITSQLWEWWIILWFLQSCVGCSGLVAVHLYRPQSIRKYANAELNLCQFKGFSNQNFYNVCDINCPEVLSHLITLYCMKLYLQKWRTVLT